jgi:hypothetical protein
VPKINNFCDVVIFDQAIEQSHLVTCRRQINYPDLSWKYRR